MPHLACARCGRALTTPCIWGTPEQLEPGALAGESPVPPGLLIRLPQESAAIYRDDVQVGSDLVSPEGAIGAHPASVIRHAIESSGSDAGCCGSDGMDGPNRSCTCGQVVATEWSDCWTRAEIRFLPEAVVAME